MPKASRLLRIEFSPSERWAAYEFDGYPGRTATDADSPRRLYVRMEDNVTWLDLRRDDRRSARTALAARAVRGDRGEGRRQVLLGARASAGTSPISTIRIASPRTSATGSAHEVRHRPPARRAGLARAARRQARRLARPSRLGHRATSPIRLDALAAAGLNLTAAFGPQHGLRGDKQDNMVEIAGLHRSGPRHPGVQPLRRGAPPDRPVDGHVRHDPRRPAGPRLPDLHLHHHAALRARGGGAARQGGLGARPPQSRRPPGRGADAARRAGRASSAPGRCRCATA